MTARPHDLADLYLSPVTIELDRRLAQFEGLSEREIDLQVALETDRESHDHADRRDNVLSSLTHAMETHGWAIGWVPRGLRVSHGVHAVVLGLPDNLRIYING